MLGDPNIPEENKMILQVDFVNTFNVLGRTKMFEQVREHFPEISHWVEST